ncbi:MAG: SDR family oxidoreductase [Bacteroidota bacterium]
MQEKFSLQGAVAIVTGATGLLGQEHCRALAGAGASVVALDLQEQSCQALTAQLPGNQHLALTVDVTNKAALQNARQIILDRFGHIDVLVNNAAINDKFETPALAAQQSRFEHYPLALWQQSIAVNLTGVFLAAQVLGSPMVERGKGSIINIASTYGIVGPDQSIYRKATDAQAFFKSPAYAVTKGGVLNFTRFLAAYWGPKGVRVNTLSPGGVRNGQEDWFINNYQQKTLLGRMAEAEDYQGALIFLASEASAYMTGANLVVDGGWTAI